VDFLHGGKGLRLDLGGAAGDDEPRAWPLAPRLADRLARLADRFAGDGAGVEDDGVREAVGGALAGDRLGFAGVQPAAEGDDIERPGQPRSGTRMSQNVRRGFGDVPEMS